VIQGESRTRKRQPGKSIEPLSNPSPWRILSDRRFEGETAANLSTFLPVDKPHSFRSAVTTSLVLTALAFVACSCSSSGVSGKGMSWESRLGPVPDSKITAARMHQQTRVQSAFIQKGRYGRRWHRPMKPRYITIHSTQNYTGDAHAHAKALKRGALKGGVCGYLCWHFTVQDDVVIQHIPTNERGEHADFDGPGNRYSIGIEMCEHKGNDLAKTIDRTAQLTAVLMFHHDIPLSNVVPHYHWPRRGKNPANKNCPHFLLENGKPGATWNWFKSRVKRHYLRIEEAPSRGKLARRSLPLPNGASRPG